jgi:hypothetical protein
LDNKNAGSFLSNQAEEVISINSLSLLHRKNNQHIKAAAALPQCACGRCDFFRKSQAIQSGFAGGDTYL